MFNKILKRIGDPLIDLVFPPRCGNCDTYLGPEEHGLCLSCLVQVRFLHRPVCRRCGNELVGGLIAGHTCGLCLRSDPHFRTARSLVHYDPVAGNLLRRLKYKSDMGGAAAFERIAELAQWPELGPVDLVMPVPLSRYRLRQRGFNQSLFLARLLFRDSSHSIATGILQKSHETPTQTGQGRKDRLKNLRGAFQVCNPEKVAGKRICLIDDVFTTGATASECSRTLLKAGVSEVCVLTLARTTRQ